MEFRDLKKQYLVNEEKIDKAIKEVLLRGDYIGGKEVDILESRLASYVGVKHCISCANGTDALSLVLMAWGIKEGDAIFIPDFTFFATGEVVSFEGATPIFVDVDSQTFNIDAVDLERKIINVINEGKLTPKVIIPVDLFGLPADYDSISQIAKKYNLLVLEDGAQGFGGSINGKKVGSFGNAATTSFFPAKPLGCYGDGGAIFTNDDELSELLRSLKFHGKGNHKYDNVRIGINSRLDTIQAAILNVKLDIFIDYELENVNKVYNEYTKELKKYVETPHIPLGYYSSFAQYTIKLKNKNERDRLQEFLLLNKIPTMIYYPKTMSEQKAFKVEAQHNDSYNLKDIVLSLPMHPYLLEEDINYIIRKVKEFFTK